MHVKLLAAIISPDWLKYGFIGLVAIVNILIYYTIRPIIQHNPTKKTWPIMFIVASLILLLLGGVSTFLNDKMKFDNKKHIDSVELSNQSLKNQIGILTDKTPEAEQLRAKIAANQKSFDSLSKINASLGQNIDVQKNLISDLVAKSIIEALETDLIATSGKRRLNIPDVNFKRLRRAVFLNILSFNADASILQQALTIYNKQSGELTADEISRILEDLPNLMRVKLKWLKKVAIPALNDDIKKLQGHPMTQEGIQASVKLPDEAIILAVSDNNGGNHISVENMADLNKEKDLLMHRLAQL